MKKLQKKEEIELTLTVFIIGFAVFLIGYTSIVSMNDQYFFYEDIKIAEGHTNGE